ncbi:MAG: DUF1702 family protein [Bryobacteraceae bacterium]
MKLIEIAQRLRLFEGSAGAARFHGFCVAFRNADDTLAAHLDRIDADLRGFAYEGAGMMLAVLDVFRFRFGRFERFAQGACRDYVHMVYAGAGLACAYLPWVRSRIERLIQRLDPKYRWLVVDGVGFSGKPAPAGLSPEGQHAFDHGYGRRLWFQYNGDAEMIARLISTFDVPRRRDLWSGAGAACAYTGAGETNEIQKLPRLAGRYLGALAEGAAFAAVVRRQAGYVPGNTGVACEVLCGVGAAGAAALASDALDRLSASPALNTYDGWRRLLQDRFDLLLAVR